VDCLIVFCSCWTKRFIGNNLRNGTFHCDIVYGIIETVKANSLLGDDYLQVCLDGLAKKPEPLTYLLVSHLCEIETNGNIQTLIIVV
jgi:hypothetical protein